jgi:ubiquinone/menaquinone biosynthesis C-methylase UbiE
MPDPIFEHPRLVSIYDHFDGPRHDLDHYVDLTNELQANCIADIGCGTGSLACLLAEAGYQVIGIDPAQSSLAVAQRKPLADKVRWIHGDASSMPSACVDVAFMTGNVAQVFLTDEAWDSNLCAIHRGLRPDGYLIFETRDPTQQAWRNWTRDLTYQKRIVPDVGLVEGWCDLIKVDHELVSFCWTYVFASDGQRLISNSTLRFRDKTTVTDSLQRNGYQLCEIRDAPDRPKQEFVFIAKANKPSI